MPFTDWFTSNPCKSYREHEQLYQGLKAQRNEAILCLQLKAQPMVAKQTKAYQLDAQQTEEILNQATLIFLQKIESGKYEFQGHAPTTYVTEVAKRLAMATSRKKKPVDKLPIDTAPLDNLSDFAEYERKREAADLVGQLLHKLDKACATVIRVHHIDGYSDDEAIQMNLTPYSTKNSLKMKRSACMKKLIKIAHQWRTSTII